jgi:hypothetical protein
MAGALLHSPAALVPSSCTSRFSVPRGRIALQQRIRSKSGAIRTLNGVISSSTQGGVASRVVANSSQSGEVDDLWAWLTKEGAVSNAAAVRPSVVKEGVGLVTQRAVRKGEDVLQVPRDSWICLETVKKSDIGRSVEGQRPWVKLALFLIKERANPSSKWLPYIDSLPQTLDSTLFW